MADLSLKYLLYGEDRSASNTIKGVGTQATSTAGLISGGFSKMGNMIGGEVGDMLNRVSMGFDQVGEKSKGMGAKLAVGGTAIMGLGLAMQTMASKDIAAQNQLNAAVEATGKGYAAFGDDVERLIQKQVQFGHADDEVKTALRTLTTAYNDPKKALQEMNLVTDLAAAKHIALTDAATMVAKAHGGAARVFKEFGVIVGKNADGTKNYDGALTVLSGKLKGQASASMDTFGGKVQQVKTWIENQATTISEKYGPAVTVAGGAVTALGSVMQVMAARSAAAALATTAETTAVEGSAVAMRGAAIASRALAIASGPVGLALVVLTTVAGAFIQSQMTSKQREDDLKASLDSTTGAITDQTRKLVALQLQQDGTFKLAASLGVSAKMVTDAALGEGDALDVLRGKQADANAVQVTAIKTTGDLSGGLDLAGKSTNIWSVGADKATVAAHGQSAGMTSLLSTLTPISGIIKGQSQDQKELASATTGAVGPTKSLAEQEKALAAEAKAATDKINAYHQALQDAGLVVLSTRDAQRQLIQSVKDAGDAVTKNGKGLDVNTQKGRDNAIALDNIATKALGMSKAVFESTHSEEAMRQSLIASRASLVESAIRFGMTKDQANKYADSILKIPPHAKTDIELAGDAAAKAKADSVIRKLRDIPTDIPIMITVGAQTAGSLASTFASQVPKFRALGGPVTAGVPYIVGERGPEVLVPNMNGTILPNNVGMAGGSGSGGGDLVTNMSVNIDGKVLFQAMRRQSIDEARRNGSSGLKL